MILVCPKGRMYEHVLKFMFKASNNEDDYKDLSASMEIYNVMALQHLISFSKSQLFMSQVKGVYEA